MKPLQRKHLTALIQGDLDAAATLRPQFGVHDRNGANELLRAATAVCLEYRFGPGAGLGGSPVDRDDLAAFMTEVREAGRGSVPVIDYLAIEAVVRSLYGEPHLFEPLDAQQRSQALYAALRHQVTRHQWIGANPDHTIERAKQLMTTWILGIPGPAA